MHSALWVSKTGMAAQDTKMTAISNNLANVNTVGFKRDRVVFEDLFYVQENVGCGTGLDFGLYPIENHPKANIYSKKFIYENVHPKVVQLFYITVLINFLEYEAKLQLAKFSYL